MAATPQPQPINNNARSYLHDRFLDLKYLRETAPITDLDDINIYRKFQTGADQDVHYIRFCNLKDNTSRGKEFELKCCTYPDARRASSFRLIVSDEVINEHRRGFHRGFIIDLFRLAVRCDARVVHVRKSPNTHREILELRGHGGRVTQTVEMWMCITCSEWHFDEKHTHWPELWCTRYQPGGPRGQLLVEFLIHKSPQ